MRLPKHSINFQVSPTMSAVLLGLFLTVGFVLFQLVPSDQTFGDAYARFAQFDTFWYENIATQGYHHTKLPEPGHGLDRSKENVAFFPAYPLAGRFVHNLTGIPMLTSLIFAAQLLSWMLFTYLILLMRRWKFSVPMIAVTFLLILSYPASFHLVAGYSESIFLGMAVGMIYWQSFPSSIRTEVMSALHGFFMSASRLPGIALSLYIPLRLVGEKSNPNKVAVKANVMLASVWGAFAFFLFCAAKFGNWKLYFDSQFVGWGLYPQYGAIFELKNYFLNHVSLHLPGFGEFGLLTIPFSTAWMIALAILEATIMRRQDPKGWKERLGIFYCAFILFFITISGGASFGMMSITRYMFQIHFFLSLVTMHMVSRLKVKEGTRWTILVCIALFAFLLLKIHVKMSVQFMDGGWVG